MTELEVYRCPLHGFEVVDLKYLSDHEINEPVCTICGHKLIKED
jgi:hypothetical protein